MLVKRLRNKQIIGEEGCGVACEEATLFKDEEGVH